MIIEAPTRHVRELCQARHVASESRIRQQLRACLHTSLGIGSAFIIATALLLGACVARSIEGPTTYLFMDENILAESRVRWKSRDKALDRSRQALLKRASFALQRGPFSVTEKAVVPPSGDVHDYLNYALEYWPQPGKASNAPWIRRQGQRNPNSNIDSDPLVRLSKDCEALALAYFFTGDQQYARHLSVLLRAWFLDDATKMNPNAKYGAVIPGRKATNFPVAGLANIFVRIINAAQIAELTKAWTKADELALKAWMGEFLVWLETSDEAQTKGAKKNNHGTHYDLFTAMLAMYIGDRPAARSHILRFRGRLEYQVARDGSQPFEMDRHNNLGYHRYNLQAALKIALISDQFADVDLWHFTTRDGVGLEAALDFLAPFAAGEQMWSRFPGRSVRQAPEDWLDLYAVAARVYGNKWSKIVEKRGSESDVRRLNVYTSIIAF